MSQKETRKLILSLARGYVQRFGFNGFSFQTIADDLGIKKASIHYHFKSKEEMGLAILDHYIAAFAKWSEDVKSKSNATLKLEAYFKIFERFIQDDKKVCPIGVLSSDFHTLPETMRSRLWDLHDHQRKWLITTMREGRHAGEFADDLNETEAADTILSAIQGGLLASRIRGDFGPLRHLKNFVFKTVLEKKRRSKARGKR